MCCTFEVLVPPFRRLTCSIDPSNGPIFSRCPGHPHLRNCKLDGASGQLPRSLPASSSRNLLCTYSRTPAQPWVHLCQVRLLLNCHFLGGTKPLSSTSILSGRRCVPLCVIYHVDLLGVFLMPSRKYEARYVFT
jgi:hypothetical protein